MPNAGWNPTSIVASTLIPARSKRSALGTVTSTSKVRVVELVIDAILVTLPARRPAPAMSTLTGSSIETCAISVCGTATTIFSSAMSRIVATGDPAATCSPVSTSIVSSQPSAGAAMVDFESWSRSTARFDLAVASRARFCETSTSERRFFASSMRASAIRAFSKSAFNCASSTGALKFREASLRAISSRFSATSRLAFAAARSSSYVPPACFTALS